MSDYADSSRIRKLQGGLLDWLAAGLYPEKSTLCSPVPQHAESIGFIHDNPSWLASAEPTYKEQILNIGIKTWGTYAFGLSSSYGIRYSSLQGWRWFGGEQSAHLETKRAGPSFQ